MATSTFFDKTIIDDKAADVLIKGFSEPRQPLPKLPQNYFDEGRRLLRLYNSKFENQSELPQKQQ